MSPRLIRATYLLTLLITWLMVSFVKIQPPPIIQSFDPDEGSQAKRTRGEVSLAVAQSVPPTGATGATVPASGFSAQTRLGYNSGDQWEPAIATDRFGHVYLLFPQYGGVPGCADCSSPTMILQVSNDRGNTWSAPRLIYSDGRTTGQWDAEIVVDPVDGRTVYAAWLQNGKSAIAVSKSTNFGATWTTVIANSTNAGTDKPILIARGQDVYVAYNHAQTVYVATSHNGGATFTEAKVNENAKLGWSLAGGGAVTPNGKVYFSWAGYKQNGGAKGAVNLYVSQSADGGVTWSNQLLDVASAPPDCSAYACGWAYLGSQAVMASDAAGGLYALWNANPTDKTPNRMYFSKSTNGGATWSARVEVSSAPAGTHHNFPAIAAGAAGEVRIAWMDARAANGGQDRWNTYYRSSTNGGTTWSAEIDVSTYISGLDYIYNDGFRFPFGDYYELDLDDQGTTHLVMGQGYSYDTPGSVWYVRGR